MANGLSAASLGLAIDGAISRFIQDLAAPPATPDEERTRAMAKFHAARKGTLAILQDLTQTQVDFFPATRVWSIGQNVEHLLLTEKLYRTHMQSLIELAAKGGQQHIELTFDDIDNSIAMIPREVIAHLTVPLNLLNMFVPRIVREAMFRTALIPGVTPRASNPALRSQPIGALRSRAQSSLNSTEEMLNGKLPPNLMKMTLSHPILGVNNIAQILAILAAHEERHHGQIRAVLANPRFPPAVRESNERVTISGNL